MWRLRREMMQRIFVILPGHWMSIYHLNVTVMTLPTSHSNANSNPKLLGSEIFSMPRWPSVLDILPNLSMSYLNNGLVILNKKKFLHWTSHFYSRIECNISMVVIINIRYLNDNIIFCLSCGAGLCNENIVRRTSVFSANGPQRDDYTATARQWRQVLSVVSLSLSLS